MPIDLILAIVALPCSLVLLAYRKTGSARLPLTTAMLRRVGIFPVRKHYYEPMFDTSVLERPLSDDRFLPGIDLDAPAQLDFLKLLTYSSELIAMDLTVSSDDPKVFSMQNDAFRSGDADYLYQFIRATKPRKVIEIGSGNSTKIADLALKRNVSESGIERIHICIEPYEISWLETIGGIQVIRKRVEACDIDWTTALQDNDLLFIDSSHMIRPQGDILKEYLEIIPQLASGVYVHVHDIFTPKDYLEEWVKKEMKFWNEQYLLESLLANTARYKIVGALNYLKHHHYASLKEVCPYLTPDREPGSIYFRVR
ncbi:MAG: class I SAM-dependent methyltransferase [Acidobacteriota bacterium]|nr:class I SAM-dependent methyltransferase [Acidobacteriota bacterium]